jgi:hypothetical protein
MTSGESARLGGLYAEVLEAVRIAGGAIHCLGNRSGGVVPQVSIAIADAVRVMRRCVRPEAPPAPRRAPQRVWLCGEGVGCVLAYGADINVIRRVWPYVAKASHAITVAPPPYIPLAGQTPHLPPRIKSEPPCDSTLGGISQLIDVGALWCHCEPMKREPLIRASGFEARKGARPAGERVIAEASTRSIGGACRSSTRRGL